MFQQQLKSFYSLRQFHFFRQLQERTVIVICDTVIAS